MIPLDGQWTPADIDGHTAHEGTVQIGINNSSPSAQLEIHHTLPKGIDPSPDVKNNDPFSLPTTTTGKELVHLRLSGTGYNLETGAPQPTAFWDIQGHNTLIFKKNESHILNLSDNRVRIEPNNLILGSDFYIGQNSLSPDGSKAHFLSFNLLPHSFGWGSGSGSIMQATENGSVFFYSNAGGYLKPGNFSDKNTLSILSNGNLGVGTLAPSQLFTLSANHPVFRLDSKTSADWEIYSDGGLRFRGGTDGVGNALADHLVIKEDGDVLINVDPSAAFPDVTGSTQTYKMYVNGGVACKEVKVRTGWADYVFDKDYSIQPLTMVESFINANHHLPNMPSAQKVQKEGVELGAITTLQQEKIEELFLHMIELEKRITELEKENQLLKTKK